MDTKNSSISLEKQRTPKSQSKWYEDVDYYDDDEIDDFNKNTSKMSTKTSTKNSRHSLETETDDSEESEEFVDEDQLDVGANLVNPRGEMSEIFQSPETSTRWDKK